MLVIYKRYGTSYQSVDIDFDAKAINDFGFRRNRKNSFPVDELESRYQAIETVELLSEAEGSVQTETLQLLLDRLEEMIVALGARLPEGGILVMENQSGHDYPKARQDTKNVIEEGENRLHFLYTMSPAARIALYAPTG